MAVSVASSPNAAAGAAPPLLPAALSARLNTDLAGLAQANSVIDARSPAEYALDHIPGAVNCPALSDAERREVGTLYVQVGAFEARRLGGGLMAAHLADYARTTWADRPRSWRPAVYCWRGGMRSGAMVQWMRMVGWDARQLTGGYKTWRRHVLELVTSRPGALIWRVVAGSTGSGKTHLLHALAARGEQVLDLEGLAGHRGSVLGGLPGAPQPSQTAFETRLAVALAAFDAARPVWVEAESPRIGTVHLPVPLVQAMRAAPQVVAQPSLAARQAFLLRDYAHLLQDRAGLVHLVGKLRGLHANEMIARWQAWAEAGQFAPLVGELLGLHYDPLYARALRAAAAREAPLARLHADALDAATFSRWAGELMALPAEGHRSHAAALAR